MSLYLDYNASAPIDERVLDKMISIYRNVIGNADSRTHDHGDSARKVVEEARQSVAALLAINKDEVFFTSGATEGNNIAIQGLEEYARKANKLHIVTTAIEHKAVLETAKAMEKRGFEVDFVIPTSDGRVSVEDVMSKVRDDTLLVSVMHVNNETGIIQPVREIGELLSSRDTFFHIDATQSFGKLVDELRKVKYDMMAMSAHKLGGPQGIGALILRKKHYKLPPVKNILFGGQQERGLRPGTVPVALIAGLGKACDIAASEYKENENHSRVIKNHILDLLDSSRLEVEFNGDQNYCIPSTVNICIAGVASEALMLSSKQFCSISNGSACNANSYSTSYVLNAMGKSEQECRSSIRISWGRETEIKEAEAATKKLIEIAESLI